MSVRVRVLAAILLVCSQLAVLGQAAGASHGTLHDADPRVDPATLPEAALENRMTASELADWLGLELPDVVPDGAVANRVEGYRGGRDFAEQVRGLGASREQNGRGPQIRLSLFGEKQVEIEPVLGETGLSSLNPGTVDASGASAGVARADDGTEGWYTSAAVGDVVVLRMGGFSGADGRPVSYLLETVGDAERDAIRVVEFDALRADEGRRQGHLHIEAPEETIPQSPVTNAVSSSPGEPTVARVDALVSYDVEAVNRLQSTGQYSSWGACAPVPPGAVDVGSDGDQPGL